MVAELYAVENAEAGGTGGASIPSLSPLSPEYKQASLAGHLITLKKEKMYMKTSIKTFNIKLTVLICKLSYEGVIFIN